MMEFDHIHFYVEDAETSRNWFVDKLKFETAGNVINRHTHIEVVRNGSVYFLLSSALNLHSPVAAYLHLHPPGVVDVAFQVKNLDQVIHRIQKNGGQFLQPVQFYGFDSFPLKWVTLVGWNGLHHTLIESPTFVSEKAIPGIPWLIKPTQSLTSLLKIDHVVLNVEAGQLNAAIQTYQNLLDFKPQQRFNIQTNRSGLQSQVLTDATNNIKFPINQPISKTSQIHEFIENNQGSGIQHIALKTSDILNTVTQLRQQNLPFLSVPQCYYDQLKQRRINQALTLNWEQIQAAQILIDWQESIPEALLLQIFTQPIFDQPTFFFEFIERRIARVQNQWREAQGFGEGNFQALFEAVEQEQLKRMLNSTSPHSTQHIVLEKK